MVVVVGAAAAGGCCCCVGVVGVVGAADRTRTTTANCPLRADCVVATCCGCAVAAIALAMVVVERRRWFSSDSPGRALLLDYCATHFVRPIAVSD